ncbi:hypothetical protein [Terrabacter sp. MAHUQ-38]|uniref:hypothetical protein n=1 Tax=unclassified Terrabacter TaxID=2630222 RepID=UPI00165E2FFB|nr:hypothetical protein [Terrabacter sp. MAHUQ-38]MBC9820104.1 hypothetical protein [Terrabacter sp. MAHUQ-38]
MNDKHEHDKHENRKPLTFTIDGQTFTTHDDDQEAASLLRLAGVDPAQYDLAKVKHNGEPKVYRDEKVIDLNDGDAFVTVRQSAQVA